MDPVLFILGLAILGLVAGALTTVAGMGGGLLLLAVLGWLWDPHMALAVVTPALLLGNLHRAWLYRLEVNRAVARRILLAAAPTSLLAAGAAAWIPGSALALVVGVLALGGLALSLSPRPLVLSPRMQVPAAAVCGAISGTGGGAGIVLGPMLLSAGLRARPYVASMAVVAVGLHLTRMLAFGANGLMSPRIVGLGVGLALAILVGNGVGDRLLSGIGEQWESRLQIVALAACAVVAIGEALG